MPALHSCLKFFGLAVVLLGSTLAQSATSDTCLIPGFRDAVTRALAAARASAQRCGDTSFAPAAPLEWNDALFIAASRHSADMARRNYFDHVSPSGARAADRVGIAGYNWRTVGENIAAGDKSVESVMASWMRSPGHCRNIMNPAFDEVAVACVERQQSKWGTYWTMVLARRR